MSFGVYGQVLKRFRHPNVTQLALGRRLLGVFSDADEALFSDSTISDLFNGKKNLNHEDVRAAGDIDPHDALARFEARVVPLLDEARLNDAAMTMRAAFAADDGIPERAVIDSVESLTKSEALCAKALEPVGFLTGSLLYLVRETRNRGTAESCRKAVSLVATMARGDGTVCDRVLWSRGASSLKACQGDMFALADEYAPARCIVTVPVDTGFCVWLQGSMESLEPGLVSENSVHGIFLMRMLSCGATPEDVHGRVVSSLVRQGVSFAKTCDDPLDGLPIGSVAAIDEGSITYYRDYLAIKEALGC